jgi:hypothetical protein
MGVVSDVRVTRVSKKIFAPSFAEGQFRWIEGAALLLVVSFTTGNRQPATGNRQPATGNRQPATGKGKVSLRACRGVKEPGAGRLKQRGLQSG